MSGDETIPAPTDAQLQALNAFRAPAMSRADLELNVQGTILEAIVNTADRTGLVAGEASDALQAEIFRLLFHRQRRLTMELALRLGEDEVLELQRLLRRAQDSAAGEFPDVDAEPAP